MALPDYSKGGFYNPRNPYPGKTGTLPTRSLDQHQIPGYQIWATEDPQHAQGEWQHRLTELGLGGYGPTDRAAQNLYNQAQTGYEAAQSQNMQLYWPEYLDTLDIGKLFANQSADARGVKQGKKYRWSMRGV